MIIEEQCVIQVENEKKMTTNCKIVDKENIFQTTSTWYSRL